MVSDKLILCHLQRNVGNLLYLDIKFHNFNYYNAYKGDTALSVMSVAIAKCSLCCTVFSLCVVVFPVFSVLYKRMEKQEMETQKRTCSKNSDKCHD